MTVIFDRDEFLKDRREMLLALDPELMRAYAAKWFSSVPKDDERCIAYMHVARLDDPDFPQAEREYSRQWLAANGYKEWIA